MGWPKWSNVCCRCVLCALQERQRQLAQAEAAAKEQQDALQKYERERNALGQKLKAVQAQRAKDVADWKHGRQCWSSRRQRLRKS